MFTQKISMDCTQEQYEKYLKDELLKMGYKVDGVDFFDGVDFLANENIIANNAAGHNGLAVSTLYDGREICERTYLGSFNATLFLALAAMTDKAGGNYGEYVIGLNTGKLHRMSGEDRILPEYKYIRKATKEEIMAKFGDVKTSKKIEYPLDVSCKTDDESYFYATEPQMISHLKSKGYKILKPKTWEEI